MENYDDIGDSIIFRYPKDKKDKTDVEQTQKNSTEKKYAKIH